MTNHLMQNNSYPQSVNPDVSRMQPQFSNHDEIDLQELLLTLWRGKWLIGCITTLVGCLALIYASVAPEVWTTSAKVMESKINDYYQLTSEVKKFQPVFVEKSSDGKLIEINDLTSLVRSNTLFKQYIDAFNSSKNKTAFLNTNSIYLDYLENTETSEDKSIFVLNEWLENVHATPEKMKTSGAPSYYTLSFTSYSQESSYLLLKEYSHYVEGVVREQVIEGINRTISSYVEELETNSKLLSEKALNKLANEKRKTDVALQITTKAAIDAPLLSYTSDDLLPINLGKNAYLAKKEALKGMTDLSIFEPELITLNSKLKFLSDNKQINTDIEFSTLTYIDEIVLPLNKDKPKRMFIVLLGLLLGAMIGVSYVLLRHLIKD